MKTAEATIKMIDFYQGNIHDINHFLKVLAFSRLIGKKENLDVYEQEILEVSAIVHDISCPLCREKYGNTNGKNQELESEVLVRAFLHDLDYPKDLIDKVVYIVTHHHTYINVNSLPYQILLEADFLVNADEGHLPESAIKNGLTNIFKTNTGIALLKSIYQI